MKKRVVIEAIAYGIKLLAIQFPLLLLYVSQKKREFFKGMKKGMRDVPKDLRREIIWKAKKRLSIRNLMKKIVRAGMEMRRGWIS